MGAPGDGDLTGDWKMFGTVLQGAHRARCAPIGDPCGSFAVTAPLC